MLKTTLSLVTLLFCFSSCSSTTDKKMPYWAKKKETVYSKFVCSSEYKRWMNFNNVQPLDSYRYGKKAAFFLAKRKGTLYKIVFKDLNDIGDFEIFDEPLKDDVLQDGCKLIFITEYSPD